MRYLPVQKSTQVTEVLQLEAEEFAVKTEVVLSIHLLVVIHARRDEEMLAHADDFVNLALHVAELFLLCRELVRLSESVNFAS